MTYQITAPIGPFCRDNGVSKTRAYELINDGEIVSVTIGRKRYIIVQSYIDFLRRRAESAPALASPNPRASSRIAEQPSARSPPPTVEARPALASPIPRAGSRIAAQPSARPPPPIVVDGRRRRGRPSGR
jgi:hypothetical protein